MSLTARPASFADVAPMREAYRAEACCQIIHDSALPRGIADAFLIEGGTGVLGYGGVWNKYHPRQVMELYLLPEHRDVAADACRAIIAASGATHIEAQTNLPFLHRLLSRFGAAPVVHAVLFQDTPEVDPNPAPSGALFRPRAPSDEGRIFEHYGEPVGDHVVELGGVVVATGGYLCHYNPPYADLYMEVHAPFRRRGIGAFMVRSLRARARLAGKTPAARCNLANTASHRTLTRAGLEVCAELLTAPLA